MDRILGMFLILSLGTFVGCNKQSTITSPSTPAGAIIPLVVGNSWLMADTSWDQNGVMFATQVDTFLVVRDTVIAGEKAFVMHWRHIEWDVTNRSDGYYENIGGGFLSLEFKYPANPGDSIHASRYHNATMQLVSVDSTVVAPAGHFHSYVYRTVEYQSGYLYIFNDFLDPDLGWIGSDRYRNFSPSGPLRLAERSRLLVNVLK
jgi:hypothetical protein